MEELPQIVWLRGDEPYCPDFALDADAVMERLGIKRTRLTQISGRELRVGRIRRGRYVAPVYRALDVEAYAAWTRPTAAHLKSSQILGDAARALEQQGDAVAERVHDDLRHLLAELAETIQAEGRERERQSTHRLARVVDEIEAHFEAATQRDAVLRAKIRDLSETLRSVVDIVQKTGFVQEFHNREIAELRAAVVRLEAEAAAATAASVRGLQDFGVALAGLDRSLAGRQDSFERRVTAALGVLGDAAARQADELRTAVEMLTESLAERNTVAPAPPRARTPSLGRLRLTRRRP